MLSILSLQPFYGGSHRQFMEGWIANSNHKWTVVSLPDRNWKWRMRQSAIYFADQSSELITNGEQFDAVFCTDMMNLAEFAGLAPHPIRDLPRVIYFHENQFEYPNKDPKLRDFHFSFSNFVSTLAADEVWFNSEFNRDSMIEGIRGRTKRYPDNSPLSKIDGVLSKSAVQEPGVSVAFEESENASLAGTSGESDVLEIVWAARWEHDKNPADLLAILRALKSTEVPFRISVLGQRYSKWPEEFDVIANEFADQIEGWGFLDSRDEYLLALKRSDVFLSTAIHEFFGLSVVEAISLGCVPLLPNRLAYPEVILKLGGAAETHLYCSLDDAVHRLTELQQEKSNQRSLVDQELAARAIQRFGWTTRANEMDQRIEALVSSMR